MKRIVIIGAGASGLTAAIEAARSGAEVTVIEKNSKAGKKILATGNGRCNITNTEMSADKYRTNNIAFVERFINRYSTEMIREYFHNLSLKTRSINGYIYPYTLQASSVVDKLVSTCYGLGVRFIFDCESMDIIVNADNTFVVETNTGKINADSVIVSTGLVAGVGVKGDKINNKHIFALNQALKYGHKVSEITPGLTGLKSDNPYLNKVSGVRWDVKVSTFVEDEMVFEDYGEIQFADYGVSGIVVFQNARFVSKNLIFRRNTYLNIDFLPEIRQNDVEKLLKDSFEKFKNMSIYDILSGIFNNKLVSYLLANAKIDGSIKARAFKDIDKLIQVIKSHRMHVTGTRGFEFAQVCAGGIDSNDIYDTFESKKVKNLYFTGEVLDVDGQCGGYNLHFAFASGIEAGKNAGNGAK